LVATDPGDRLLYRLVECEGISHCMAEVGNRYQLLKNIGIAFEKAASHRRHVD